MNIVQQEHRGRSNLQHKEGMRVWGILGDKPPLKTNSLQQLRLIYICFTRLIRVLMTAFFTLHNYVEIYSHCYMYSFLLLSSSLWNEYTTVV